MNLSEKGWFQKYLVFRQSIEVSKDEVKSETKKNRDYSLYKSVQPTGLMYGHPVLPDYIKDKRFDELASNERMKVVLVESLLHSAEIDFENISKADYQDFSTEFAAELIEYYYNVYPELEGKKSTLWGKKKSKETLAEEILDRRLYVQGSLLENLWVSFFHNSLLFLDVFYFMLWVSEKGKIKTVESFRQEKEVLRLSLLKVIAAASNADNEIQKEERKLFNMFLKSANLDRKTAREAKTLIDEKLTVDDIDFPATDSWIIKKYFLELAILTVWADQVVADEEKEFIVKLSQKLGFTTEEMENSMVAIESFVLTNWNDIHFFLKNKDYKIVGTLLLKRLGKIAVKNKDRIATEMRESKELMQLVTASVSRDLSPEEKEKVRIQLIDILKILPTFVIIALPGTFLTLPILLKILPKSAWPTAFQE